MGDNMSVFTLILAGGENPGLSTLVEDRPAAALPFAGKYRIIDFTLSNCANSGLSDVAVLTQYRPHSLNEHIGSGRPWDLDRTRGGIHTWQPYRGRGDQGWQRGTADALYQNRGLISATGSDTLLVLSGDHIYKQDYRLMLRQHEQTGARVTLAVREVPSEETSRFGIVSTDEGGRIVEFYEKPSEFKGTLASMGVYVFNTEFLLDTLEQDANDPESEHDFGRNIIPVMLEEHALYAYTFEDFWVDVGTLPIYWLTSLDLLSATPPLDLYDHRWTIHTRSEERPPVKLAEGARVEGSLLSNGCVIAGAVVNSVLSPGVIVEAGAEVRDSIVMNDTVISSGARIDRCILDKQIVVGRDAEIGVGDDTTPNRHEPANLNTGITIVGKAARIPAGARIGRNCLIQAAVREEDFPAREISSGDSVLAPEL
jgi:glucose-1-phosphate adenylyltransferase